jgi:hypothetical protein
MPCSSLGGLSAGSCRARRWEAGAPGHAVLVAGRLERRVMPCSNSPRSFAPAELARHDPALQPPLHVKAVQVWRHPGASVADAGTGCRDFARSWAVTPAPTTSARNSDRGVRPAPDPAVAPAAMTTQAAKPDNKATNAALKAGRTRLLRLGCWPDPWVEDRTSVALTVSGALLIPILCMTWSTKPEGSGSSASIRSRTRSRAVTSALHSGQEARCSKV